MSWFQLFRGFFGHQPREDQFLRGMTREDDGEDDEFIDGRRRDDFGFGSDDGVSGHHKMADLTRDMDDLVRDMDDLFKGLRSSGLPGGHFDHPDIEAHLRAGGPEEERGRRTPRDWMLKLPDSGLPGSSGTGGEREGGQEPGTSPGHKPAREGPSVGLLSPDRRPWNPFSNFEDIWKTFRQEDTVKEDKDLDSRVNSEGLENILKPSRPEPKSYFKSVSVSKVILPDGTVEERRTTRDGDGNEETKITRAQGDQSYTTVTQRDAQGNEEQTEHMSNMDERDLQRFAEKLKPREGSDALLDESRLFREWLSLLDQGLKGIFSSR